MASVAGHGKMMDDANYRATSKGRNAHGPSSDDDDGGDATANVPAPSTNDGHATNILLHAYNKAGRRSQ